MIAVLIVVALAFVALAVQAERHRKALGSAVALERARQDMLLNRLASRNPAELVAYEEAATAVVKQPAAPAPPMKYLYDDQGLTQIAVPADETVDA